MNNSLKSTTNYLGSILKTRTGFLGLGPTYGEVIICSIVEYAMQRHQERQVVKEAQRILEDINRRNNRLF